MLRFFQQLDGKLHVVLHDSLGRIGVAGTNGADDGQMAAVTLFAVSR